MTALAHQLSRPLIMGIAGCSGAGKTSLVAELVQRLDATAFPLDLYYRDLSHLPLDTRQRRNFDHPDSLESELIIEHVRALAEGQRIERPVYDFKTHTRVAGLVETIMPRSVVIVEGILALHYADLARCYGFSIYVDAPQEACLARRIERDMRERGRTEELVRAQYMETTLPMAERYVVTSAVRASMMVDGTGPLERSVEQVLKRLHENGLTTR